MPTDPDITLQVALLGQQVNNSVKIFDKFDAAVDKLTGLTIAIQSTLQSHDVQIQRNAERVVELANTVYMSRKSTENKMHELEKTLVEKLNASTEKSVSDRADITTGIQEIKQAGLDQHNEIVDKLGKHDKRLSNLEKWMWILVGGGMVLAFLLRDFNMAHVIAQLGSL